MTNHSTWWKGEGPGRFGRPTLKLLTFLTIGAVHPSTVAGRLRVSFVLNHNRNMNSLPAILIHLSPELTMYIILPSRRPPTI